MSLGPMPASRPDPAQAILERFRKASESPEGLFDYPTGRAGLAGLGYPQDFVDSLPEAVAQCYCGVGQPFAPGLPGEGQSVLDVGCGAGLDALFAARVVGPRGRVEGLEFSPHMLARASENARLLGAANVGFSQGGAEALPYPDQSFDLVVSNGVFNLVQDKPRALAEVFRVLKGGGRFQLADQILEAEQACPLPGPGEDRAALWAR